MMVKMMIMKEDFINKKLNMKLHIINSHQATTFECQQIIIQLYCHKLNFHNTPKNYKQKMYHNGFLTVIKEWDN